MATSKRVLGTLGIAAAAALGCPLTESLEVQRARRILGEAEQARRTAAAELATAQARTIENKARSAAAARMVSLHPARFEVSGNAAPSAIAEVMRRDPAIVAKAREYNRRYYASKYAALIAKLGLSAAQADALETILVDRSDLIALGYPLRMHSDDDIRLKNAELEQLLGSSGFQTFKRFELINSNGTGMFRQLLAQMAIADPGSVDAAAVLQPVFAKSYHPLILETLVTGNFAPPVTIVPGAMLRDVITAVEPQLSERQRNALRLAADVYLAPLPAQP